MRKWWWLIYIEKELYNEISGVMANKSKMNFYIISIALKDKTAFLLNRSSKFAKKRKTQQKYDLEFNKLGKWKEKNTLKKIFTLDK